ncbi:MAG: sensor histidine kinase, partial [Proteobacteria bacterium]|nr:sensor histidine kinase [Pseudomonadota bacterium]
ERERIARDIHDELGSTLVAIKIETALLGGKLPAESGGGTLRDKAHSIEALVDRAMSTVSRVARELRPGILKEFGLPAAIECQAEDFSQRTGIVCRVKCDDDGIELDEKSSLALFRILQEALTNVAKHAHASLVVVRLRREKDRIALEIRDNGRGVSEADMNKPKSFGLRGIRERASSLNGEFSITPVEQGGTLIVLRVPDMNQGNVVVAAEEEPQGNLF